MGGIKLRVFIGFIIISAASLFGYMFRLAHTDKIRSHTVTNQKIPPSFSGFRIFFIADIHRRNIRWKTLEDLGAPPDIVCIAGDLIERGVPLERMKKNIHRLKKWDVPIYFVWGNNDYENNPAKVEEVLRMTGVAILKDQTISIQKNGDRIHLLGFDYYFEQDLPRHIDWDSITGAYTILLTHKPSDYRRLDEHNKSMIDLVLSGHTHGGQIRIFNMGFYQKGGLVLKGETAFLVTEGYGYTLLPLRLGTNAECHIITLQANDKTAANCHNGAKQKIIRRV